MTMNDRNDTSDSRALPLVLGQPPPAHLCNARHLQTRLDLLARVQHELQVPVSLMLVSFENRPTLTRAPRGKYLEVVPTGVSHVTFKETGDHYTWTKVKHNPSSSVRLLMAVLTGVDHHP